MSSLSHVFLLLKDKKDGYIKANPHFNLLIIPQSRGREIIPRVRESIMYSLPRYLLFGVSLKVT